MPGSPRTAEQRRARALVASLAARHFPNDSPEVMAARVALSRANRRADLIARVDALVAVWGQLSDEQLARIEELMTSRKEHTYR